MKFLSEPTELELYGFPWQAPLSPINYDVTAIAAGHKVANVEPDDMSVIERRLYEVDALSHEWRKAFFQDVPPYLAKYFAERYIRTYEQKGARAANSFLREKMHPAKERVLKVLQQYKQLPNTQKVALLSKEFEDGEDPFHPVFFTEYGNPEDIKSKQVSFDFEKDEKDRKPVKQRLLAELEQDELRDMAFRIAKIMEAYLQLTASRKHADREEDVDQAVVDAYEALAHFCTQTFGIKAPRKYKAQNHLSASSDIMRMINDSWWLGRLVKVRKIMREHLAIAMGQVSNNASPYASWDCVREHQEQQQRNYEVIKNMVLFDEETEEEHDLWDMVKKSVSNPAIRRHELMVRCRGCEDIGNELGLQGLFLTLTTPSKYHNSYKKGGFIDHWNGASPRDAQAYLNKKWQLIRAKLNRDEIRWFGVRVAEPHHDGTPHWHLLIWVRKEDISAVRDTFITYATEEDRGELHPEFEKEKQKPFRKGVYVGPLDYRPRCDFGYIDPAKGTATGYIAKYISKNIDGYAMDGDISDETGKPVKDMARNVSAWKSRWSIRQFQFFGGAPVTTYRELRRLANQNKKAFMEYIFMQERADLISMYELLHYQLVGAFKPARVMTNQELVEVIAQSYEARAKTEIPHVAAVLRSADEGCWHGYIMNQGGPFVKRKELLVTNVYQELPFASPYAEAIRKLEGIATPEQVIKTREKVWTIKRKGKETAEGEAVGFGSEATAFGGSAASRSSVNNCTEPFTGQVSTQLTRLLQPDRLKGSQNDQIVDEVAISALFKGSTLRLDDETELKIRPAEVDEHGKIRPARLVEVKREVDSDIWCRFDGWEKFEQQMEKLNQKPQEPSQPDLSFFKELEGDWPLA
ncbi:replication endonuclease [Vibrio cholerae]|uniref:replication endonuclease n=1 Tax=Vibrio cholerae TaxID=666 RepID=UPI00264EE40C|nr:replication endonuclease [Vibrio cholerae]MDN6983457.1 replication endonuclease [Vibrio cholerae]